jgi:hypothetical protein
MVIYISFNPILSKWFFLGVVYKALSDLPLTFIVLVFNVNIIICILGKTGKQIKPTNQPPNSCPKPYVACDFEAGRGRISWVRTPVVRSSTIVQNGEEADTNDHWEGQSSTKVGIFTSRGPRYDPHSQSVNC